MRLDLERLRHRTDAMNIYKYIVISCVRKQSSFSGEDLQ
jgi:hypothetical protein